MVKSDFRSIKVIKIDEMKEPTLFVLIWLDVCVVVVHHCGLYVRVELVLQLPHLRHQAHQVVHSDAPYHKEVRYIRGV